MSSVVLKRSKGVTVPVVVKKCSRCYCLKNSKEFYKSSQLKDGLSSVCKKCEISMRLERKYNITLAQKDFVLVVKSL